jgi:hypothetical protein
VPRERVDGGSVCDSAAQPSDSEVPRKRVQRCSRTITGPVTCVSLENTIERAVVFASGSTITRDSVKVNASVPIPRTGVPSLKLRQNVEWIERETIARALELSAVKQQAARLMGISPRALSYYLAKYRLMDDDQMRRRLQARQ